MRACLHFSTVQGAALVSADCVAAALVSGMKRGKFAITVGVDGWLANCIASGWNPETALEVLVHALFIGPLHAVAAVYIAMFNSIVAKHWAAKKKKAQ